MNRVECEAEWIAALADVVRRLRELDAERVAAGQPVPPGVREIAAQVRAELQMVRPEGAAVAREMLQGIVGYEEWP